MIDPLAPTQTHLSLQIQLLKEQLRDGAETQEVLEIQLQEVAGRWKAVLSEKDVRSCM